METVKGYIKTQVIKNPKIGDPFVWFKGNEWCFGTVTGEGCLDKTRVVVDGSQYETHTNTLKNLIYFNESNDLGCAVYDKDWEEIIKLDIINKDKLHEFKMCLEQYCSYPGSCECSNESINNIEGCDLSYAKPVACLNGVNQVLAKNVKYLN